MKLFNFKGAYVAVVILGVVVFVCAVMILNACISEDSLLYRPMRIETSDLFVIAAVLTALFAERVWRSEQDRKDARASKSALTQTLTGLRSDLKRIRDDRDKKVRNAREPKDDLHVGLSDTCIGEIEHYGFIFESLVIGKLRVLDLPVPSKVVELYNHYTMNLNVGRKKRTLKYSTLSELIRRVNEAIEELENN